MTKKIEDAERLRKAKAPRGERTQKAIGFRCDLDNIEFLQQQPNMGRFLNDLIRKARGA